MRAALYARVSTRDKRSDTEDQLAQLREFARSQGWTIVGEYTDYVLPCFGPSGQAARAFCKAWNRARGFCTSTASTSTATPPSSRKKYGRMLLSLIRGSRTQKRET